MEPVIIGSIRERTDEVRRYRPVVMSFDFTARHLTWEISDDWEPEIRAMHEANRAQIRDRLIRRFGTDDVERKIHDYIDLGVAPISVLAVHNTLLNQIRDAFSFGAYYPALVAAGALGERLLNELVLRTRDKYFAGHEATRPLRNKSSVDNWPKAVDALLSWGVVAPTVAAEFETLKKSRNNAVHFGIPDLHLTGGRSEALSAIHSLQTVISALFDAIGGSDLFIPGSSGAFFIKREAEALPLFREFYLPACALVSPQHTFVDYAGRNMHVVDNVDFEEDTGITELTDADFIAWQAPAHQ